jgi:hypothetical protein
LQKQGSAAAQLFADTLGDWQPIFNRDEMVKAPSVKGSGLKGAFAKMVESSAK